jgi:excinuclease ABC subunit C
MKTIPFTRENILKSPQTPGVYIFRDPKGKPIYIGKAKNLKNRLTSYIAVSMGPKTYAMVHEATNLSMIQVNSEIEALLLESNLVKKYLPKYNIELKDDKSPLYIAITKEPYPRVLTLRQTQLASFPVKRYFGPFVNSGSVRKVLKLLRRVTPYSQHPIGKRACIYHQIGLCNPCPNTIVYTQDDKRRETLKREYISNITRLTKILSGKPDLVKTDLQKEMERHAKLEEFEEASIYRERLAALHAVTSPNASIEGYVRDPEMLSDIRYKEAQELSTIIEPFFGKKEIVRIECFDIAHLSGTHPTASMVTFINGEPDKHFYRHFRIKKERQNNDTESMREVLTRRSKYFESWGKPDLLVVDGGKGQLSKAIEVLGNEVTIVGLAKRYETIIAFVNGEFQSIVLPDGGAKNLMQRIRDEAHRFARRYHHKLVTDALLSAEEKSSVKIKS